MSFETLAGKAMRAVLSRRNNFNVPPAPAAQTTREGAATLPPLSLFELRDASGTPFAEAPLPDMDEFGGQRVLHLTSWPHMRAIPPDRLIACARVCALLSHGPSVGFLVHRRLGLPREAVLPVLHALHADGCLRLAGDEEQQATTTAAWSTDPYPESTRRPNVWVKLLQKLLG